MIIDSGDWLEKRLKHLHEALASGELTDSQRVLVETEIQMLEDERRHKKSKRRRWFLFGGRRPPD